MLHLLEDAGRMQANTQSGMATASSPGMQRKVIHTSQLTQARHPHSLPEVDAGFNPFHDAGGWQFACGSPKARARAWDEKGRGRVQFHIRLALVGLKKRGNAA